MQRLMDAGWRRSGGTGATSTTPEIIPYDTGGASAQRKWTVSARAHATARTDSSRVERGLRAWPPIPGVDRARLSRRLRLCPGEFRRDHGDEMAWTSRGAASELDRLRRWSFAPLGVDIARTIFVHAAKGLP